MSDIRSTRVTNMPENSRSKRAIVCSKLSLASGVMAVTDSWRVASRSGDYGEMQKY